MPARNRGHDDKGSPPSAYPERAQRVEGESPGLPVTPEPSLLPDTKLSKDPIEDLVRRHRARDLPKRVDGRP